MSQTTKRFYTIRELIEMGYGSRQTIYRRMKSGALPYIKIGRAVRIPVDDFEAHIASLKRGA